MLFFYATVPLTGVLFTLRCVLPAPAVFRSSSQFPAATRRLSRHAFVWPSLSSSGICSCGGGYACEDTDTLASERTNERTNERTKIVLVARDSGITECGNRIGFVNC